MMKRHISVLAIILALATGSLSFGSFAAGHAGKGDSGMQGGTEMQQRMEHQQMDGAQDEGDRDRDRDRDRDQEGGDMDRDRDRDRDQEDGDMDRDRDRDRDQLQDDS